MKLQHQQDYAQDSPESNNDSKESQVQSTSSIHTAPIRPVIAPSRPMPFVFIKNGRRHERLFLSDILYLKAHGSYCKIVTSTKNYTLSICLSKVLDKLDYKSLVRCHRSYAVNKEKIDVFDDSSINIFHGTVTIDLPMSAGYRTELLKEVMRL